MGAFPAPPLPGRREIDSALPGPAESDAESVKENNIFQATRARNSYCCSFTPGGITTSPKRISVPDGTLTFLRTAVKVTELI